MILDNCRITIRELANEDGISFGLCQIIFKDDLGSETYASEDCSKIAKF